MSFRFIFPVAALFLSLHLSLQAQEWTRFRGPNGSGIGAVKNLPSEFTAADFEWNVKLLGTGHSSPVLWGDLIFLTVLDDDGTTRKVLGIDSTSGKTKWTFKDTVTTHSHHRFNSFASSTPTCDANAVYIVWASGTETVALAVSHAGVKLWQRSWPNFTSDHGHAASPVLIQGKLIFHTDSKDARKSYVIALDPKTGESVWELERVSPGTKDKHLTSYSTPVQVMAGTRPTVAVVQTNDGWKGLDPATGSVLWSYGGDYKYRSVGSIVESDGLLFSTFGSGGGGKQSSALRPNATAKPDVVFELAKGENLGYVPTPLIHDGLIYILEDQGGIFSCRDAKTGERVYGSSETRLSGNFFSSPVLSDGKIYCASKDGDFICIQTGKEFRVLGRSKLDSGVNATPAIANGRLFVRTDTHLFSLKGK